MKKLEEIKHKFWASLPLMCSFGIIIYLYIAYMTTYLSKLLANEYYYNQTTTQEGYTALFLTMKTITAFTNLMLGKLYSTQTENSPQEQKGIAYFVILHVLLVLLLIAKFRTIYTPPGHVPQEWSCSIDIGLQEEIEKERNKLLEERKTKRKERREGNLEPIAENGQMDEEDQGDREDAPLNQEDQRENTNRSELESSFDGSQASEYLNELAELNVLKRENKRLCTHCKVFKPERTHHCKQCDACILKMDHHCIWEANCIGLLNYKYFFNLTLYGVISLLFVTVTYTELVVDTLFNSEVDTVLIVWIFFTYIFAASHAILFTLFYIFHCWLFIKGRTTLEVLEQDKAGNYSLGLWNNLKSNLGTDFLLWLIPTRPRLEDDGLSFKEQVKA